MRLETWIYPWDLRRLGVRNALAEMRDLGLAGLKVASNYHPIGTLSPRADGRRVMYTELGAVYFAPRLARYGRIQPEVWPDAEVLRAWSDTAESADAYGLGLSAWTIGMFQPWITRRHPDCARVAPTGDPLPSMACPGSPDVQEYFAAMCADLAGQFPLQGIHLEGSSFHHYDYGWVRPRILIELAPWTRYLMGLCFCQSCRHRAQARGVDVEGLRARVLAELERCYTADGDQDPAPGMHEALQAWRERDADFRGLLACREDAVAELIRGIAEAVHAVSPRCRIGVWNPVEVDGSAAVALDRVLDCIGSVLVWHPHERPEQARAIRRLTRDREDPIHMTHFQACGWPHGADSPEFLAELQAAYALPVDCVAFYNYGLLRAGQMRRMVDIARAQEVAR